MHRTTEFLSRHLGPRSDEMRRMLEGLQLKTLEDLANSAVPASIRLKQQLDLPRPLSEQEALDELKGLARKNIVFRSLIGTGYSGCITPAVIQRNLLENPGWYTQYTPYQAEIAQGRLEALLNFQTLVCDLTGLPIANASLLDEGTAVAEAMAMAYSLHQRERKVFFISEDCHPQVIEVVRTRAEPLGVKLVVGQAEQFKFDQPTFGVVVQYPNTQGTVRDYSDFFTRAKAHGAFCIASADLLALTLVKTPGEMGADIAVGSVQRFGVPVGFGGPHAAYFSTKDEFKRVMPGRLVGVSKDAQGRLAYRLALQTREQHIRREKATSNICTAQVLLANIASMYAVYHGAEGLTRIAKTVQMHALQLEAGLKSLGYTVVPGVKFDTVAVLLGAQEQALVKAEFERSQINLRFENGWTGVSLDEITNQAEVLTVLNLFAAVRRIDSSVAHQAARAITGAEFPVELARKTPFLEHSVFKAYRSETEMQRYIRRLESRDLSLTHSMIPLGSCTMKLNAASELMPITWPEFGNIHPFAPQAQWQGYATMLSQLESWLSEITGFAAVSLQPNAGSQGEFAGLLVIREYHRSKGNTQRDVCLIPKSAHGTNPASAVMAGMRVVVVDCDVQGNVDVADLKRQAEAHKDSLAALMITYPSTHGVFETSIREICEIIHSSGGLVYMDGANMNAQVGLCRPGDFGPDVCHLNLHKTFCIPHGGGGPGMGPIGVAAHLKPFLPGHPLVKTGGSKAIGPISSAPYGSASILPISWMYIRMMGAEGLKQATQVAILNANYVAEKLNPHYPVLYRGINGRVAHECIVDLRQLKSASGVEVEDVAKRLMDYGFHAPTVSFPVPGTLMIEPTESESLAELERFCEAMISIRQEIQEIIDGKADSKNNVLKMAPHTAAVATQEKWDRPYSREKAVYPAKYVRENKFWPHVGRIDNVYGDRNLICSCAPIEDYQTSS